MDLAIQPSSHPAPLDCRLTVKWANRPQSERETAPSHRDDRDNRLSFEILPPRIACNTCRLTYIAPPAMCCFEGQSQPHIPKQSLRWEPERISRLS